MLVKILPIADNFHNTKNHGIINVTRAFFSHCIITYTFLREDNKTDLKYTFLGVLSYLIPVHYFSKKSQGNDFRDSSKDSIFL